MLWLKAWESIRVYENHMKAFGSIDKGVILMVFISVVPFLNVFWLKKGIARTRVLVLAYDYWKVYEKLYKSVKDYLNQKHSFP